MVHLLGKIQPRFVVLAALVTAGAMFGSAIMELRESRKELFHLLREQSLSLSETIANNSANIVLSTDEIERQLSERLLNNALHVARLDSLGLLTGSMIRAIAEENDIFRINIFSRNGTRVLSNHPPDEHRLYAQERHSPKVFLQDILNGKTERLIIGLKEARFEPGERFAVAVQRTKSGGGAIVLNLDAAELLEFRKNIGIGKLIKDLGNNEGIEYVVLQDREGIVAATTGVSEMSRVEEDPVLAAVLESDTVMMRETSFASRQVYEVVRGLSIDQAAVGVLRIGLSMDEIRTMDERLQRRLFIMTLVLIGLGVLTGAFLVASKNYNVVSKKFERHQILTGTILEQMRDAVVTLNRERVITVFNRQAEELFGISAGEVIGKTLTELPDEPAHCLHAILDENRTQFEISLLCADSGASSAEGPRRAEKNVLVTISVTGLTDGSAESTTAVIKDVTDIRRLEKEVQRKEKLSAMGELASGVAHEIRNPLNAIAMIAQRYDKEFTPKSGLDEYRSLTNVLKSESSRVNAIIHQFLTYARPANINPSSVRIEEFVGHIATLVQGEADEKKLRLYVDCTAGGLAVFDASQMTQALLNIIRNAVEATTSSGEIRFSVVRRPFEIQFIVEDTGEGIPEGKLEKIFNLYFTTKANGNGLGLSITHQVISQHGGTIDVQSTVGKGTRFTVTLPQPSSPSVV